MLILCIYLSSCRTEVNEKDFKLLSSEEYFPNLKIPEYISKSYDLNLSNI